MKTHELKTWPEFFAAIADGRKKFEVRKDDRNFLVGELLLLREYDPEKGEYTGAELSTVIKYKLPGGSFGIQEGFCVLGI